MIKSNRVCLLRYLLERVLCKLIHDEMEFSSIIDDPCDVKLLAESLCSLAKFGDSIQFVITSTSLSAIAETTSKDSEGLVTFDAQLFFSKFHYELGSQPCEIFQQQEVRRRNPDGTRSVRRAPPTRVDSSRVLTSFSIKSKSILAIFSPIKWKGSMLASKSDNLAAKCLFQFQQADAVDKDTHKLVVRPRYPERGNASRLTRKTINRTYGNDNSSEEDNDDDAIESDHQELENDERLTLLFHVRFKMESGVTITYRVPCLLNKDSAQLDRDALNMMNRWVASLNAQSYDSDEEEMEDEDEDDDLDIVEDDYGADEDIDIHDGAISQAEGRLQRRRRMDEDAFEGMYRPVQSLDGDDSPNTWTMGFCIPSRILYRVVCESIGQKAEDLILLMSSRKYITFRGTTQLREDDDNQAVIKAINNKIMLPLNDQCFIAWNYLRHLQIKMSLKSVYRCATIAESLAEVSRYSKRHSSRRTMFNFPQNPQDQESFLENTIVQFSSRQGLTRYEIVSEDVYNREENMTQTQQGSNIEGFKVPKFRFVIDMRTSQSIVSDHVTRYRSSQADTSNLTQATQQTQVPSQFPTQFNNQSENQPQNASESDFHEQHVHESQEQARANSSSGYSNYTTSHNESSNQGSLNQHSDARSNIESSVNSRDGNGSSFESANHSGSSDLQHTIPNPNGLLVDMDQSVDREIPGNASWNENSIDALNIQRQSLGQHAFALPRHQPAMATAQPTVMDGTGSHRNEELTVELETYVNTYVQNVPRNRGLRVNQPGPDPTTLDRPTDTTRPSRSVRFQGVPPSSTESSFANSSPPNTTAPIPTPTARAGAMDLARSILSNAMKRRSFVLNNESHPQESSDPLNSDTSNTSINSAANVSINTNNDSTGDNVNGIDKSSTTKATQKSLLALFQALDEGNSNSKNQESEQDQDSSTFLHPTALPLPKRQRFGVNRTGLERTSSDVERTAQRAIDQLAHARISTSMSNGGSSITEEMRLEDESQDNIWANSRSSDNPRLVPLGGGVLETNNGLFHQRLANEPTVDYDISESPSDFFRNTRFKDFTGIMETPTTERRFISRNTTVRDAESVQWDDSRFGMSQEDPSLARNEPPAEDSRKRKSKGKGKNRRSGESHDSDGASAVVIVDSHEKEMKKDQRRTRSRRREREPEPEHGHEHEHGHGPETLVPQKKRTRNSRSNASILQEQLHNDLERELNFADIDVDMKEVEDGGYNGYNGDDGDEEGEYGSDDDGSRFTIREIGPTQQTRPRGIFDSL